MVEETPEKNEFGQEDIITFPNGIQGFEELTRFVLTGEQETYPSLSLQSVDDPWVSFTVIDPFLFFADYSVEIPDIDKEILGLNDTDSPVILSIVFVPEDPSAMTANLLAPIVINPRNRVGRQVILQNTNYSVRQPILEKSN